MYLMVLRAFWLAMNTLSSRAAACLNAPYGAPCFLTRRILQRRLHPDAEVLMHLMALRAFWLSVDDLGRIPDRRVLMHLMVLRAF